MKTPIFVVGIRANKPRKAFQFSSANPTQQKNFEIDLFIITCYFLYRSTVFSCQHKVQYISKRNHEITVVILYVADQNYKADPLNFFTFLKYMYLGFGSEVDVFSLG
jgi:hypothetical protein